MDSSLPSLLGLVREALVDTGLNLFGSAPGLIVVASGGRELWTAFRAWSKVEERMLLPHPLDAYVGACLDRADHALAAHGVAFGRAEPTIGAEPALDFISLAERARLGSRSPFRMLIHPVYGAWWALRGAYFFDDPSPACTAPGPRPCDGCPEPCRQGQPRTGFIPATIEVRTRCIVGPEHRYEDEQLAYHYDRAATLLRLQKSRS